MRSLLTRRLRLRALTAEDLAAVNAACNDAAAAHLSEEALRWMAELAAGGDPHLGGGWSFRHRLTGRLIGLCLYSGAGGEADGAEISYIVVPPCRRRAYCREAMEAVTGELFDGLGFTRLYADVAPDNVASMRVLARLAFAAGDPAQAPVHVGLDRRPAVRLHLAREAWVAGDDAARPLAGAPLSA